jgi:hypothetical protein
MQLYHVEGLSQLSFYKIKQRTKKGVEKGLKLHKLRKILRIAVLLLYYC